MITLITGAPGAGKSAALVDLLSKLAAGRALFVSGVPELLVPHTDLDQLAKSKTEELGDALEQYREASKNRGDLRGVNLWHLLVPDGSAVVADEVQNYWRPRGPGQRVPPEVAALETHRHRGLDFFLVTQGPGLLDKNVRALVGRHIHLRDVGVLGRWWYEWPEVSETLAWKTAPIKKRYRLPKTAFKLYRSASIHIKPIRSFPMALVVAALALCGVGAGVFMAYKSISAKISPTQPIGPLATMAAAAPGQAASRPARRAPEVDPRMAFTPRLPDEPATAPAYDHLRVVAVAPRIIGGFCRGGVCRCFTQQGTNAPISNTACADWIANPPFDPYRMPDASARPAQREQAQPAPSESSL